MAEPFDPYSEWLGIREPLRPLSHYQLLGIADFEDNALAIAVGADSTTARLKACNPGSRSGRWQQLLDEITLARLCLQDSTRKRQYDDQLKKRLGASIPSSGANIASAVSRLNPAGEGAVADATPPAASIDLFPPNFQRPPGKSQSSDFGSGQLYKNPSENQSTPATQNESDQRPKKPTKAVPNPAVAVPKALPLTMPGPSFESPSPPLFVAVEEAAADSTTSQYIARRSWAPSLRVTIAAGILATGGVMLAIYWQSMAAIPPIPEAMPGEHIPGNNPVATPTEPEPHAVQIVTPRTITDPEPPPQAVKSKVEPDNTLPLAPALPQSSAITTTQPAQPDITPSPEEIVAFDNAFRETLLALRTRSLDRAKMLLQQTKQKAKSEEQQQRLEQLEHLHGYLAGYWQAVRSSFSALQATDTLPVGNTEVAIVEIDGDRILIRDAGRNRNFMFRELPAEIVIALAAQWFDASKPSNKLYLGAFYAIDKEGDLQKARELWQEATAAGASADTVMPLLDDPAFTTTNR